MPFPSLLRDRRDRLPVLLTLLPAAALLRWPGPATVALSLWWTGNTVAHHAVHRRLFRGAWAERAFAVWLSLLLGVPQRLWRQLHLAHHAGRAWRLRPDAQFGLELGALAGLHAVLLAAAPGSWLGGYLPGLCGGLLLSALQGHFEHAGGVTDCRAPWWNVLFLNDGWHAEHHAFPKRHWTEMAREPVACRLSVLPPVLRWLAWLRPAAGLDALERLVLRWPWLQARVLAAHRPALAALLQQVPEPTRVVIVGGGLFPRTAILLRELLPRAELRIVDGDAQHLAAARSLLPAGCALHHGTWPDATLSPADLVVLPLALRGDRALAVSAAQAPFVLAHEWAWQRRGEGRLIAWWLGKRLNLLRGHAAVQPA